MKLTKHFWHLWNFLRFCLFLISLRDLVRIFRSKPSLGQILSVLMLFLRLMSRKLVTEIKKNSRNSLRFSSVRLIEKIEATITLSEKNLLLSKSCSWKGWKFDLCAQKALEKINSGDQNRNEKSQVQVYSKNVEHKNRINFQKRPGKSSVKNFIRILKSR